MDLRSVAVLSLLWLAIGLGPVGAQGTSVAPAPVPVADDGPLAAIARTTGLRSKPVEAPDFVRSSRPAETSFIPVHSKRPEAPGKLLTADELSAKERELDTLKASHDAIAKRPPSAVAYKPLQAPAQPK